MVLHSCRDSFAAFFDWIYRVDDYHFQKERRQRGIVLFFYSKLRTTFAAVLRLLFFILKQH